jgi:hypothetical protein
MEFTAETQRTLRFAKKKKLFLCASAVKFLTVPV